jgi:hypothetical protein
MWSGRYCREVEGSKAEMIKTIEMKKNQLETFKRL